MNASCLFYLKHIFCINDPGYLPLLTLNQRAKNQHTSRTFFSSTAYYQDNFSVFKCTHDFYNKKVWKQFSNKLFVLFGADKQTHRYKIKTHQHPSSPNCQHRTFSRRTALPTASIERLTQTECYMQKKKVARNKRSS